MAETPPVRLPGYGALLADGTHITEEQFQLAIERLQGFTVALREGGDALAAYLAAWTAELEGDPA